MRPANGIGGIEFISFSGNHECSRKNKRRESLSEPNLSGAEGDLCRAPPGWFGGGPYTGVAVFRGGLKNGSAVTFTSVFSRIASIVTSSCNCVPSFECSVSTLSSAINFFRIGDQLVVVALPTCFSPAYRGTATRDAWLGAAGVSP